ncbi:MAG: response regulator transcription factor [Actinobacteria bacterium]|nr:response regulator transcription factor [Actinomycetota bacterium]
MDDHAIVREGLATVISDSPDFDVVGQAGSAEEALAVVERTRPDCVLVDMRLPGRSGMQLCAELRRRDRGVLTLLVSSLPSTDDLLSGLDAGARGFVVKESDPSLLIQALKALEAGHHFLDPRVASTVVRFAVTRPRRQTHPFGLTTQELRVVSYLPSGFTNREIATELGIGLNTVKSHVHRALQKLGAKDRAEAASIVLREGLV